MQCRKAVLGRYNGGVAESTIGPLSLNVIIQHLNMGASRRSEEIPRNAARVMKLSSVPFSHRIL